MHHGEPVGIDLGGALAGTTSGVSGVKLAALRGRSWSKMLVIGVSSLVRPVWRPCGQNTGPMAIPQSFIQELLARADVVEIVGRYVQLKKTGANFVGPVPVPRARRRPSFTVSPTKQFYHCFGCGKNGNAIGFLMEHAGMGFIEAVKDLAGQYGMEVPEDDASPQDRERAAQQREKQATLTDVLEKAGAGLPQAPEEVAARHRLPQGPRRLRRDRQGSSAWATRPRAGARWPACSPTTTTRCWPRAAW